MAESVGAGLGLIPDAGCLAVRHARSMKTIAAVLTLLALAAPAALATEFPGNENPRCTYQAPKKMRLKAALSRGIPGVPGISNSGILTFEQAGTKRLRVNILPKRFFRRYARTTFRVLLGVERTPPYHTSVDSGKLITVVR
jgi:hypothetical protein